MADPGHEGSRRSIVLVGFMGSGKSAVGRSLARRIGWASIDIDTEIERREGRTVARIFEDSGEGHFRAREQAVLREVLEGPPAVVATGGGTFMLHGARRRIRRRAVCVWLDVSLELVRERLGSESSRPLWPAKSPVEQRILFEKRRAAYALAEIRIDSNAPESEVVERILRRVSREPPPAGS